MQQRIHFYFLLLFLSLHDTGKIFAQAPGVKFFLPEENNTKLYSIFKNKEGYLITGGSNGLNKFDGIRFKKTETNIPSLADTVTAIFQDNKNDLWTGYQSGRIAKTTGGKLTYIEPEEGTPKKRITSFLQDKENNIWLGTRGEGIYYLKKNGFTLSMKKMG